MPSPVLTIAEMRRWEQATWREGQTAIAVIDRVGQAIAQRLLRVTDSSSKILLLAGHGNNGADARAAARNLEPFREAIILEVSDPSRAIRRLREILAVLLPGRDWVVDGLFGLGLNRPIDRPWQNLIGMVNRSGLPILAVDLPSGLDADTGEVRGAAIRATATLTIGAPKIGLLQPGAVEWVGRLEVANDVGLSARIPRARSLLSWVVPADFSSFPPARPVIGHKGTFGHVAIVAGSLGWHGAAVLAARGAARARPGLVTVITDAPVYGPVAAQLQSAMVRPWDNGWPLPPSVTALVAGPGLAADKLPSGLKEQVTNWWRTSDRPMLVDASALAWLPHGRVPTKAFRVITPHPGEAARLLQRTTASVMADRPGALKALSRKYGGCQVVLKGHQTLIGGRTGRILVNSSGNSGLAQGGSGDLLAGYLGGLLAQPLLRADWPHALAFGVWQHGAAADQLSARTPAWTVEELATTLGGSGGRL